MAMKPSQAYELLQACKQIKDERLNRTHDISTEDARIMALIIALDRLTNAVLAASPS